MKVIIFPIKRTSMELVETLLDFKNMVNHLIAYSIHKKVSGYNLRNENRNWFRKYYGDKYASHYLHSAAEQANSIIKSWNKSSNKSSVLPYQEKLIMRLDKMLVKVKNISEDEIFIRIIITPRKKCFDCNLISKHKKFKDLIRYKIGEITLKANCIYIPFRDNTEKKLSNGVVGIDLNFKSVDMADNEGEIKEVDISEIVTIQNRMRAVRENIQKKIPTNLQKQRKLLKRIGKREYNRINDRLHKVSNKIIKEVGDKNIVFENLSMTTIDCIKDVKGKEFKAKLSSWVHGRLQRYTKYKSLNKVVFVNPRGTSSICAGCGGQVIHPTWKESYCPNCKTLYDRDKNAAINILVKGIKGLGGQPLALNAMTSLLKQSVISLSPMRREMLDNHADAMKGDVSNESVVIVPLV